MQPSRLGEQKPMTSVTVQELRELSGIKMMGDGTDAIIRQVEANHLGEGPNREDVQDMCVGNFDPGDSSSALNEFEPCSSHPCRSPWM